MGAALPWKEEQLSFVKIQVQVVCRPTLRDVIQTGGKTEYVECYLRSKSHVSECYVFILAVCFVCVCVCVCVHGLRLSW